MKKLALWAVFSMLLMVTGIAFADTCGITTVDNLLGNTCSIGDKTFGFTGYTPGSYNQASVPAADIVFTPNASNPLAPSFTLSSPSPGFTSVSTNDNSSNNEYGFLYFNVAAAAGNITALGASIMGPVTISSTTSTGVSPYANVLVENLLYGGGPAIATAYEEQTSNYGSTSPPVIYTNTSAVGNSGTGYVYFETDAQATATATIPSATYTFYESTATTVPEPGSLALVGTGLLGLASGLRRKYRR
jgi:hypothetical protein